MTWLIDFVEEVARLFNETAFFLLLGFGLAGILRFAISESRAFKYFRGRDLKSVTAASLFGVPLPLCSCSVLPVAASLRKQGASRGATSAFLISTPETGVDSIATSYALLDPILTVVRPVAAFVTAVVTGMAVNWFGPAETDDDNEGAEAGVAAIDEGCGHDHGDDHGHGHDHGHHHDHDHSHEFDREAAQADGKIRGWWRYSFVVLLDELGPYLILGFLLSGVIGVLVPSAWFANPVLGGFGGMLLMLVIGIPMYVCATGSTPVAAALLLKGLNPGAAVVFLLAGPATNIGALVALKKYLGKRTVIIYLICIAVVSLLIGFFVDGIYVSQGITASAVVGTGASIIPEFVKTLCSVLLLYMMVTSAMRTRFDREWADNLRRWCRPLGFNPVSRTSRGVVVAALLVIYVSTGVSSVAPGETAWVVTFGKAGDAIEEPGMVAHWPWPIQSVKSVSRESIRRVSLGTVEALSPDGDAVGDRPRQWPSSRERLAEQEAEVLAGDANILVVQLSIHYGVTDAFHYAFRVADADALVRRTAEWAARRVTATMSTDDLLIGHQDEVESRTREILQEELDALAVGLTVHAVRVLFVHAPERAHSAFRDIASAEEDRLKENYLAERNKVTIEQSALSEAYEMVQTEKGNAAMKLALEQGRADAFRLVAEAWRDTEEITRSRLWFDALDKLLSRVSVVVNMTDRGSMEILFDKRGGDAGWMDMSDDPTGGFDGRPAGGGH